MDSAWEAVWPAFAAAAILGYLLGSIPFGLILTRLAGKGDIRAIGSGNIGATNVLRTGDRKLAAATLVADALKGTAAVLIGASLAPGAGLVAGFAAFLGHLFPVWLGFRGGKGVATWIGVALGAWWPAALIFCGLWLATAFATRYSSLSAIVAAVVTPLAVLGFGRIEVAVLAAAMSALLLLRHHGNIRRLMKGEESRIGAGR
jgi:glycerol-3-phosphate acyltransferase PlsY